MANSFSSLTQKKSLSGVVVISIIYAIYKLKKQFKPKSTSTKPKDNDKKKHKKVGVNSDFIEQMKKLLPVCIPGKSSLGVEKIIVY